MPDGQIIITGASRGIGAAIALNLEKRGYAVVGLSRTGHTAAGRGMQCDMTDETAVRQAFADIAAKGPVQALISTLVCISHLPVRNSPPKSTHR